jgi:outer membrane immunogenic protein
MTKTLMVAVAIAVSSVEAAAQTRSFDGVYAGGSIGSAAGSADLSTSTVETVPPGYDRDAGTYFQSASVLVVNAAGRQQVKSTVFYGGGLAGVNWRSGRLVVGGEVDFGSMGIEENVSATGIYPCCPLSTFVIDQSLQSDWVMTARPRLGYVVREWLFYGTGGVALTQLHYRGTFNDSTPSGQPAFPFRSTESATMDQTVTGWTAGAGAEYAIAASDWSLAFLYLYADFGSATVKSTNLSQELVTPSVTISATFPNAPFTHSVNLHTHILRLGVNYRF